MHQPMRMLKHAEDKLDCKRGWIIAGAFAMLVSRVGRADGRAMLLHISAFLLAAGIILVLVQLSVRASSLSRARSYTLHRKKNQELIAPQIVLPELTPSKAADRLA